MYSVVLLMALGGGGEAPALGHHDGCSGCTGYATCCGCCGGYVVTCGGCTGCSGCCGGCTGWATCSACTGCSGDCHGSKHHFFGKHRHGHGSCHGCCGGCHGTVISYGTCGGCSGCCGGPVIRQPHLGPPAGYERPLSAGDIRAAHCPRRGPTTSWPVPGHDGRPGEQGCEGCLVGGGPPPFGPPLAHESHPANAHARRRIPPERRPPSPGCRHQPGRGPSGRTSHLQADPLTS